MFIVRVYVPETKKQFERLKSYKVDFLYPEQMIFPPEIENTFREYFRSKDIFLDDTHVQVEIVTASDVVINVLRVLYRKGMMDELCFHFVQDVTTEVVQTDRHGKLSYFPYDIAVFSRTLDDLF